MSAHDGREGAADRAGTLAFVRERRRSERIARGGTGEVIRFPGRERLRGLAGVVADVERAKRRLGLQS